MSYSSLFYDCHFPTAPFCILLTNIILYFYGINQIIDEFEALSPGNLYLEWNENGSITTHESIDETFTDINSFIGQSIGKLLYVFVVSREWFAGDDGKLQSKKPIQQYRQIHISCLYMVMMKKIPIWT